MSNATPQRERVAIACGGTGGHLFPGLAVAAELRRRDCAVSVLISPKEVDQQAVKDVTGIEIVTLPAVGLVRGGFVEFMRGFVASYRLANAEFRQRPVQAVLAMGGFTSAPPVLAGRRQGARTFLHESNAIPGRANRWLSWIVTGAFVGFPNAAGRLHTRRVKVTGTPVRAQFKSGDAAACRARLDLDPARPVVLVMGGSQGASGINELVLESFPCTSMFSPDWQWLHLSGPKDFERVKTAYARTGLKVVVQAFCTEMELALGAATAAIGRAGASSLAELAQMQLPAVLLPYPAATDNHQYFNARAFEETGAAVLLPESDATPQKLAEVLGPLIRDQERRQKMRQALAGWQRRHAAEEIAEAVLGTANHREQARSRRAGPAGPVAAQQAKDFDSSDRQSTRAVEQTYSRSFAITSPAKA